MGYEIFTMELRSGQTLVFVTGNVVDFPDLPEGVTTADILDVHPHEGRGSRSRSRIGFAPVRSANIPSGAQAHALPEVV